MEGFIAPGQWDSRCTSSHRPARSRFTSSCHGRPGSRPPTSCRRRAGGTAAATPSPALLRETTPARWGHERSRGSSAVRGTGRAAGVLVSLCVISGFCHLLSQWKRKSCAPCYLYTASALTPSGVGREGEGKGQWWGRGLTCTQHPGHGHVPGWQCEPAQGNALQWK